MGWKGEGGEERGWAGDSELLPSESPLRKTLLSPPPITEPRGHPNSSAIFPQSTSTSSPSSQNPPKYNPSRSSSSSSLALSPCSLTLSSHTRPPRHPAPPPPQPSPPASAPQADTPPPLTTHLDPFEGRGRVRKVGEGGVGGGILTTFLLRCLSCGVRDRRRCLVCIRRGF